MAEKEAPGDRGASGLLWAPSAVSLAEAYSYSVELESTETRGLWGQS